MHYEGILVKKTVQELVTKMSVADDDEDILQETRLYCEISNKSVGGQLVSRSRPLTLTK
jgi:hypothetical protein